MRKIAFLTDAHLGDPSALNNNIDPLKNLELVLEDISMRSIEEIVYGGDIGKTDKYPLFFKKLSSYSYRVILGNHDKYEDVASFITAQEDRKELYYTEDDEFYTYLFMDSSSGTISDNQLMWLEQNLNSDKKIVLFIHHPVLGLNTGMDKKHPLQNRDEVKNILNSSKKEITLFCGHYHMSDERRENNIRQIITHALSFQVEKDANEVKHSNSHFGYRIISLNEREITSELVKFS